MIVIKINNLNDRDILPQLSEQIKKQIDDGNVGGQVFDDNERDYWWSLETKIEKGEE